MGGGGVDREKHTARETIATTLIQWKLMVVITISNPSLLLEKICGFSTCDNRKIVYVNHF